MIAGKMQLRIAPRQYLILALFCLACVGIGAIGGIATSASVSTWYPTLQKPWFNPPDSVFAPVWTLLYLMMGVGAWRVWLKGHNKDKSNALKMFWFQLTLNLGWSLVFFGMRQIGFALAEIVLLLLAILITTFLFWRIDRFAGMLMLPYIAWVSFATLLNASLWLLNPAS
ncbi:MAG: TspO/MBR family protein [Arenicellales bacterium]